MATDPHIVFREVLETERCIAILRKSVKINLLKLRPIAFSQIFSNLPTYYQEDSDLLGHLPCLIHWNLDEHHKDHIDGPPPSQANCLMCINREHCELIHQFGIDQLTE